MRHSYRRVDTPGAQTRHGTGSKQRHDAGSRQSDLDLAPPESIPGRRVAIVGLGYVGLPTALELLAAGSDVIGIDMSAQRITDIRNLNVDLIPSDQDRLRTFQNSPGFSLTSEPEQLAKADSVIICVPTPVDGHLVPDLRALSSACGTVVEHAVAGQTIILTSTTYVGTTRDLILEPLADRGFHVGQDIHVAYSPERIDPGNAEHTQQKTPRVVGGATTECTRRAVAVLYRMAPYLHEVSTPEAAELTKLLENAFRAVNIALANEFADVCHHLELDPLDVVQAAATKPYGFMPFYPGPGVGGHCIPCDPHYLLWQLRARRLPSPLIDTAMTAIATRPRKVVNRAKEILSDSGRNLVGARVLVIGVTYKPGVSDMRESPALQILDELAEAGALVAYSDPLIPSLTIRQTTLVGQTDPSSEDWDLVIVHTVHPEINLDWLEQQPCVLDTTYRLNALKQRELV
jgi:UDP-N-acetyl-D-glucosamine dehydrogenase